jgi:molecular chaperone IbpA
MRNYDFSPLYRQFVGFDRMADLIDSASRAATAQDSYPPYNVVQTSADDYRIELAVAGFAEEDFDIQSHENVLTITARKDAAANDGHEDEERAPSYLHRGIAQRSFVRRFQLADHVRVEGAELINGLLTLSLKRELPEALKPRKIALSQGLADKADQKVIAAKPNRKGKAA